MSTELCGRARPKLDLLVTDVVMPGMSGPELVRRLESIYPGLRVLYMSGYAGEAIQKHGITEFGITEFGIGFMQKPFTVAEFLTKVRDMLDARHDPSPYSAASVLSSAFTRSIPDFAGGP